MPALSTRTSMGPGAFHGGCEILRREIGAAVVAPHDPEDFALMNRQLRSLGYL